MRRDSQIIEVKNATLWANVLFFANTTNAKEAEEQITLITVERVYWYLVEQYNKWWNTRTQL